MNAALPPKDAIRSRAFNPNIHGARGLLASVVLLFHVFNSKLPTLAALNQGWPRFAWTTLQFSVELFFCISGFVIAGTLRRARSPGDFLVDRVIRIFPVLWASMPFVLVMEGVAHFPVITETGRGRLGLIVLGNLLCFPNVVPIPLLHYAAWSLSNEMAFYTLAALAFAAYRLTGRRWLVVLPAVPLLIQYPRSLFFLPGLCVAENWVRHRRLAWMGRFPLAWISVFLTAWGLVWTASNNDLDSTAWFWWRDQRLPLALLAVIAATFAFTGIADGVGWLGRALRTRVLQWLGTISYSLYLWQFITMAIVKQAMFATHLPSQAGPWSQPLFLVLVTPPTLLVAWGSQRMLERGVSGRIRRWFDRNAAPYHTHRG